MGRYLTTQKGCHRGGADTTTTGHAGRGRDLCAVNFMLFAGRDFGKRFAEPEQPLHRKAIVHRDC